MIEYSEEIGKVLIKNNFDFKKVYELFTNQNNVLKIYVIRNIDRRKQAAEIEEIKTQFATQSGCIFTLPSGRRDNHQFIYFSFLNKNEFLRILKLKAFI